MSSAPLRALIVDDEEPARLRLRTLLGRESGVELIGECADGAQAIAVIQRERPDVAFLDVHMADLDGFETVRRLTADVRPAIIFVTAFDEYAVRAFEVHAVDYLLKPFSRERLHDAVQRVRESRAHADPAILDQRLVHLLAELADGRHSRERIAVRSDGRLFFVRIADIDWVEADANYVRLHTSGEVHAFRESMRNMESRLPPDVFLRIHRSAIVNIGRIRELQPWFHGEYIAILQDGTKLTVSRAYSSRLDELIR
jgi:two-component system LytT family response regulator